MLALLFEALILAVAHKKFKVYVSFLGLRIRLTPCFAPLFRCKTWRRRLLSQE